jgi:hypothetical protein
MPMNTPTAHQLMIEVSRLVEMTSIFQAAYGKQYVVKPGSPAEVWDLYQVICRQQVVVAHLLDATALEAPMQSCAKWWKRQDVIDLGIVTMLAQEALHLIACCAAYETQPRAVSSPAIGASQAAIAGMLHPSCVMVALADVQAVQRAS